MRDRDFASPFPPWRLFLPFMVVSMLSMVNLALSAAFAWITMNLRPEHFISIILVQTLIFTFLNVKIIYGKYIYAFSLKALHIAFLLGSIIISFKFSNDIGLEKFIIITSSTITVILYLIIDSKYYKGFIYYRMRCISVMYKIKNGERLDDGKYFYEK